MAHSQENREYFDDMYEMFATKGWKRVVADAEEAIEERKERLLRASSIDEVRFMQGEVIQLQIVATMRRMIEEAEKLSDETEIETIET